MVERMRSKVPNVTFVAFPSRPENLAGNTASPIYVWKWTCQLLLNPDPANNRNRLFERVLAWQSPWQSVFIPQFQHRTL